MTPVVPTTISQPSDSEKRARELEEDEYVAMCLLKLAYGSSEIPPAALALNYLEQENDVSTKTTTDEKTRDRQKSVLTTMDVKKGREPNAHVCDVCHKSFSCYQALGGHKSSHRSKPRMLLSLYLKRRAKSSTGGKVEGHECRVCHKIFPSGQALGGHMGVHSEDIIGGGVSSKKRSRDGKSPINKGGASVSTGRALMIST